MKEKCTSGCLDGADLFVRDAESTRATDAPALAVRLDSGNSPLLGRAASALAGLSLLCLHLVLRVLLHLVLRVRVAALGAAFCLCLAGRFLLCCEVSRDTGQ